MTELQQGQIPQENPLKKYYRQPKQYIKLPSGYKFYPEGAINVSESGEIAVYPMTAKDELLFKTPDALLNGEATVSVIQSCAPAIKNAWAMPSIDCDAALIAIRMATYGESMTLPVTVPGTKIEKDLNNIFEPTVKLKAGGYIRTGFECYSLPGSPMTKAFEEGNAHYGASGHQPGGRVNFIAVGSSSMSNLGNDYYVQNFYDLPSYKKALNQNLLPSFRGLRLNDDDKIRQHATQQIRSYFKIDYKNFKDQFGIDAKNYFKKEVEYMSEMQKDGLVEIMDNGIFLTEIGRDFTQNIMNVLIFIQYVILT